MTKPLPPDAPRKPRGGAREGAGRPPSPDSYDATIFFRPHAGDGARLQAYVTRKGTTVAEVLRGYVRRIVGRL